MKPKSDRKFEGLLTYSEIREALKEQYPEASEAEIKARARAESNFQSKRRKAYLRGQERFSYGKDVGKKPTYFSVKTGTQFK